MLSSALPYFLMKELGESEETAAATIRGERW